VRHTSGIGRSIGVFQWPVRSAEEVQGIDPDPELGWIRRLWPILRQHRRSVSWSLAAAVAAVGSQTAIPAITKTAIDGALVDGSRSITPFVVALVALALGRSLFAYSYRYGLYSLAYRIDFDLRVLIYDHLTKLGFGYFDRTPSGQIISRANSDIKAIQIYMALAPLFATTIVGFVSSLVVMIVISVPLTLVAMAALPGVYLAGIALRNRIFPLSWIVQARTADMVTVVDESITGTRMVRSFAAEDARVDALALTARRVRWANVTQADARARWGPLVENLPRLGLAAVLVVGGWLAIEGRATIGDIVAFNSYLVVMQIPFRLVGFFLQLGQRARASAGRIFEILDERSDITEVDHAPELATGGGMVEFEHVSFGYGDGPTVLRDFSLRIEAGQTVAVVGSTGGGKSTITRLLPRFYDVRDGAIRLDGTDIREVSLTSLRRAVGIVTDEPFLFSVSIRDNIAYGRPDADHADVLAAARAACVTDFVDDLADGFDTVVGERGYTLSGGQRQRVAIARTLLMNPPVLVLDDATSAIDVGVEDRIHSALAGLLANRTTLIVAHRLSTIALADRVVLLDHGQIVADGTHQDLLANEPRYRAVLATADGSTPSVGDDTRAPATASTSGSVTSGPTG